MKRSKHAALFILGATAFALSGCKEETSEASAFPDVESCISAAQTSQNEWLTEESCRSNFTEAQKIHDETAPRYQTKEDCEAQHGVGSCGAEASSSGSSAGSIFLPLLTGYLIGNMLGGGFGGNRAVQPLVSNAKGGFATPGGTGISRMGSNIGGVPNTSFQNSPVTKGQPAMSKAQVQQRGGFGASATSRGGGSSFGG